MQWKHLQTSQYLQQITLDAFTIFPNVFSSTYMSIHDNRIVHNHFSKYRLTLHNSLMLQLILIKNRIDEQHGQHKFLACHSKYLR